MPVTTLFNPSFILAEEAILKAAILIILIFYAIFALIVVRQVGLMARTLMTKISPVIKAFSIIHAGVAIGFIVLAWGIL